MDLFKRKEKELLSLFIQLIQAEQEQPDSEILVFVQNVIAECYEFRKMKMKRKRASLMKGKQRYSLQEVVLSYALDIKASKLTSSNTVNKVREIYKEALENCSLNCVAILNFAHFERENGDASEAIKLYQKVVNKMTDIKNINICCLIEVDYIESLLGSSLEEILFKQPFESLLSTTVSALVLLQQQLGNIEEANLLLNTLGHCYKISNKVWDTNRSKKVTQTNLLESKVKFFSDVVNESFQKSLNFVFSPNADFWFLTNYAERGYFSFWFDIKKRPDNVVERFLANFMNNSKLKTHLPKDIVGCEWWVHTRKSGRNLGHQLHFDTDEVTLSQENKFIHPKVSSVFYLSLDDVSGNTVVFDIDPKNLREKFKHLENTSAFVCKPNQNGVLLFPGHLLHGVLPKISAETKSTKNRLTLMVGFWTKDLSKIGKRNVLGAASIVPRQTRTSKLWACLQEPVIHNSKEPTVSVEDNTKLCLERISPAWEKVPRIVSNYLVEVDEDFDQRFSFSSVESVCETLQVP